MLSILIDFVKLYRAFKNYFYWQLRYNCQGYTWSVLFCRLPPKGLVTFSSSALHPCLPSPIVVPDLWCTVKEYGLGALHPLRAPLDTWTLSASAKPLLIFPDSTQISVLGSFPCRWGWIRQLSVSVPMAPLFMGSSCLLQLEIWLTLSVWALMVHHNRESP